MKKNKMLTKEDMIESLITLKSKKEKILVAAKSCKCLTVSIIVSTEEGEKVAVTYPIKIREKILAIKKAKDLTKLDKELLASDDGKELQALFKLRAKAREEDKKDLKSFSKFITASLGSEKVKIAEFKPTKALLKLLRKPNKTFFNRVTVLAGLNMEKKGIDLTPGKLSLLANKNSLRIECKDKYLKDINKLFKVIKKAKKAGFKVLYINNTSKK